MTKRFCFIEKFGVKLNTVKEVEEEMEGDNESFISTSKLKTLIDNEQINIYFLNNLQQVQDFIAS